jgi:hypothetical protein
MATSATGDAPLLIPAELFGTALTGTGTRSASIHQPLIPEWAPWIEAVPVCDLVKDHCDRVARAIRRTPSHPMAADP